MIDTHCHLGDPVFGDVASVLARARAAGVTGIVAVGSDLASTTAVLALAARHPEVRPAVGFHPERLDLTGADLEVVEAQARAPGAELVALGEIGLPWYSLDTL